MSTTAAYSAPRPTPSPLRAFGGIWRLTARRFLVPSQLLTFAGVVGFIGVLGVTTVSHDRPAEYREWVAHFYLLLVLPLVSFTTAGGAMRDDYASSTVDYVFTRPVNRALFVVARYVSHCACMVVLYVLALCMVTGVGLYLGNSDAVALFPTILGVQVLTIVTTSAFGFLMGSLTHRYIVWGLTYAAIVEVGIGKIPTQLNQISMLRHIKVLLSSFLGNDPVTWSQTAGALAAVVLISVLLVTMAALLTRSREFIGSSARD
jgi:ABC-type transport system involved in multi-copper enzyme maturation permease subunit